VIKPHPEISLREFAETYFPQTVEPSWSPDHLRLMDALSKCKNCNFSSAWQDFRAFRLRIRGDDFYNQ